MQSYILHSHPCNQESLDQCTHLVMQVYYDYSPVCKAAANEWEQAAKDLSQWARLGRIEWNQQYLLSHLRTFTGLAIRPDDLPVVFGFPTKCHSMACAVRCACYPPTRAIPKRMLSPNACMFMIQEARVYLQCCVNARHNIQTMQALCAPIADVPGVSRQPFAHLLQTDHASLLRTHCCCAWCLSPSYRIAPWHLLI